MFEKLEKNRGITLIALVITVIILLILAGVAISALTGANGLLAQALGAGQKYNEASQNEAEKIQSLLNELNNYASGNTPTPPANPDYTDGVANAPKLGEGFIPVKYDSTNTTWVVADTKSEWYNYSDTKKEWANAILVSDTNRANYYSDGDIKVNNYKAGTVVVENDVLCYLVWIPRYKYSINSSDTTTGYHTNTFANKGIDIVFEKGTETTGNGSGYNNTNGASSYLTHPVFRNNTDNGSWDNELAGFWVGKFEANGVNASNGSIEPGNVATSSSVIVATKPNITSWRNIIASNSYTNCLNMKNAGNPYGITTGAETHMLKNSEWGAVAYLAHSKYGLGATEITINSNSSYLTGGGDYKTNVNQSTTGNIYGVYDMSGGAWEQVAAYVNNGNGSLSSYCSSIVNGAAKYKNVYAMGSGDGQIANYEASSSKKGDAVYETSLNGNNTSSSWNGDYSNFPYSSYPLFYRGGGYNGGTSAGAFGFGRDSGHTSSYYGFRVAVCGTL